MAPNGNDVRRTLDDVAKMSYRWTRAALDALAAHAAHWTFVSSISVYADPSRIGGGVDDPLLAPRTDETTDTEAYGAVKVASENAVREAAGGRELIVRAGLLCGRDDVSGRFGYWPNRFSRGGRAIVPDAPRQPAQIVDVLDVADWIVRSGEEHVVGTFDAAGPPSTLAAVLGHV